MPTAPIAPTMAGLSQLLTTLHGPHSPSAALPQAPAVTAEALGVLNAEVVAADKGSETRFLVDQLIAMGSVNLVVGNSGIGKTPLMVQMALSVACGVPFLGLPTYNAGRPVLYVDAETIKALFADYLTSLSSFLGLPAGEPLPFHVLSTNFSPDPPTYLPFRERVQRIVEQLRPCLVVFDCLRPLFPEAEGKAQDAALMWRWMRDLAKATGCATVVIHHMRKPSKNKDGEYLCPRLQDDAREWLNEAAGSLALINQADTRIGVDFVEPTDQHRLVLAGFSKAIGDVQPWFFDRLLDDNGHPRGYAAAHQRIWAGLDPKHIEALKQLPDPFRFRDVRSILATTSNGVVQRVLNSLVNCGVITRIESAKRGDTTYAKNAAQIRTLTLLSPSKS